jgi:hypothetical protein
MTIKPTPTGWTWVDVYCDAGDIDCASEYCHDQAHAATNGEWPVNDPASPEYARAFSDCLIATTNYPASDAARRSRVSRLLTCCGVVVGWTRADCPECEAANPYTRSLGMVKEIKQDPELFAALEQIGADHVRAERERRRRR